MNSKDGQPILLFRAGVLLTPLAAARVARLGWPLKHPEVYSRLVMGIDIPATSARTAGLAQLIRERALRHRAGAVQ